MGSVAADSRAVVIVAFPGVLGMDVVGPLEVFAMANRFGASPAYTTSVVSIDGGMLTASSGLVIATENARTIGGPIDTLMVAGGYSTAHAADDGDLIGWLTQAAATARRVTSVCTGAWLLARAGVLDGRRATTHWSVCDVLAARFPSVDVETDRIYVRDGNVWTSAGVTAGMDLALALVEHDHTPAWRWQRPARWSCSSTGPAGPPRSARNSGYVDRYRIRCATSWRSSPNIPMRTCRCPRSPAAAR